MRDFIVLLEGGSVPACLRKANLVILQIRHQVCEVEVFPSYVGLWEILDFNKAEEQLSFSEIWGQDIAGVFSILIRKLIWSRFF